MATIIRPTTFCGLPVAPISIPMEDERVHTDRHPVCSDKSCPCRDALRGDDAWQLYGDFPDEFVGPLDPAFDFVGEQPDHLDLPGFGLCER